MFFVDDDAAGEPQQVLYADLTLVVLRIRLFITRGKTYARKGQTQRNLSAKELRANSCAIFYSLNVSGHDQLNPELA